MADELNVPTHRYYKPKYNVALAKEDISPKYILDSGIRKIDARIGEVEIREPLFSNNEAGVWYDPSQAANLDWRRNLLTQTEAFDASVWSKDGTIAVSANAALAPDGTMTADVVSNATQTDELSGLRQTSPALTTGTYTSSIWVRSLGATTFTIRQRNNNTGVPPSQSFTVTSTWTRFTFSFPIITSDGQTIRFIIQGTNGDIALWGAQLELGSTATEYQRITDVNTEVMERFPEATLFQDTAGTIPVTTAGQTVGLMLDKSKGLVLGSELFANQPSVLDNSGGGATVIHTAATRTVQVTVAGSSTSYPRLQINFGGITGRRYVVSGRIDGDRSIINSVRLALVGTAYSLAYNSSTGIFSGIQETGESPLIEFLVNGTQLGTVTIAALSIRELAGNHAKQFTAASRPTYGIVPFGGRRNLLTWSEDFSNAAWTKAGSTVVANVETAPDGSLADRFIPSAVAELHSINNAISGGSSGSVARVRVKLESTIDKVTLWPGGAATFANFNLTSLVASKEANVTSSSITSLGDGWFDLEAVWPSSFVTDRLRILASSGNIGAATTAGDGTSGILIARAQLETGSTATAYQRVTTQYDVTEAGVPPVAYLAFDGVDDGMVTPTITPSIDKVQVFAGVRKLSDAATSVLLESSASAVSNDGSFAMFTPIGAASTYGITSRGTSNASPSASGFAAPILSVLTGIGEISIDAATLRVDGIQVATSAANQGTGNYLSYPLYIGRRGGTSLPFNGQLYSLIARFGDNLSNNAITSIETYVASKTGVTL